MKKLLGHFVNWWKQISASQKILYGILLLSFIWFSGALIWRVGYYSSVSADQATSSESWPTTCDQNCPTVTVNCLSDTKLAKKCGDGAAACAEPEKCTMNLSLDMCRQSGFKYTTQSVDGSTFRTQTQCQKSGVAGDDDYVDNCCSVRHEYAHLCDSQWSDRSDDTRGCGETYAENIENQCIKAATQYYCGGNNPRWSDRYCENTCSIAEAKAYTKIWDACMCAKVGNNNSASSNACCNCINQCSNQTRAKKLMPSICISKGWFGEITNTKSYCQSESSSGAHSCAYYGGSTSFDPCKCSGSDCDTPTPTPTSTATKTASPSKTPTATASKTSATPTPMQTKTTASQTTVPGTL